MIKLSLSIASVKHFWLRSAARFLLPILLVILCASGLRASGPSALSIEPDTVVLWGFNEGEGDEFADRGPSGINLKVLPLSKKAPIWKEGKIGKALSFPGEVVLGVSESRTPPVDLATGEVTVEAWIKPSEEGLGHEMAILQYAAVSQWGFRFTIHANGALCWLVQNGSQENGLSTKDKLTYGEWSHVAGTYDGSVMRIFINGQLAAERELLGGVIQPVSNGPLMVGFMGSPTQPYFIGEINGIRISNKARSEFPVE